jgi:hypothetical protein
LKKNKKEVSDRIERNAIRLNACENVEMLVKFIMLFLNWTEMKLTTELKEKLTLKNSVIMGDKFEMFWNESKRNRTNVWFNFTKKEAIKTGVELAENVFESGEVSPEEVMANLSRLKWVIDSRKYDQKQVRNLR